MIWIKHVTVWIMRMNEQINVYAIFNNVNKADWSSYIRINQSVGTTESNCCCLQNKWWIKWKGQTQTIPSYILTHLTDIGHIVDKTKSFSVIYRIPSSFLNGVRCSILDMPEITGIRTHILVYVFERNSWNSCPIPGWIWLNKRF